MRSARKTCGVCMRKSSSRSSVLSTRPPRAWRTVSFTWMAGAAAPRSAAARTAREIISSVTSGRAASCMAMSPAAAEHSRTPARDEAMRVPPPVTTHLSFVTPASRAIAATSGIFSLRVTATISSQYALAWNTLSVRSITVMPPSSIASLSSPMRLEEPPATMTAEQKGLSGAFFALLNIELYLLSLIALLYISPPPE